MSRKLLMLFVVFALVLPVTACYITVVGSPNTSTRDYNNTGFTRLEIGSAFEADISRADSYRVSITANDNLFDNIQVSQSGETLKIALKPAAYIRTTQKVAITMPDLTGLVFSGAVRGKLDGFSLTHPVGMELSGASSLEVGMIRTGALGVECSGASHVTGGIQAADCDLAASGASYMELTGSGANLTAEASGASRLLLFNFKVNNVNIELSGASRGEINLTGRLDGELSGASRLEYSGTPTLGNLDISGASSISQKQ